MSTKVWYKPLDGDGNISIDQELRVWFHIINHQDDNDGPFHDGKIQTVFRLFSDGTLLEWTSAYDVYTQDYQYEHREITEDVLTAHGIRIPETLRRVVPSLRRDADESMVQVTPHRPAIVPLPNEERDRFILQKYQERVPLKVIVAKVNADPGWEHFDHEDLQCRIDAARKAMVRYCQRHGIETPRKNRRK